MTKAAPPGGMVSRHLFFLERITEMRSSRTTNGQRHWDTESVIGVELYRYDDMICLVANDSPLPDGLLQYMQSSDECYELLIKFRSQGYYEPASMYGGPDRLGWPEEGDDERTLVNAKLVIGFGADLHTVDIDDDLSAELFELLFSDVQGAELESDEW
jgi:hypothetical protein